LSNASHSSWKKKEQLLEAYTYNFAIEYVATNKTLPKQTSNERMQAHAAATGALATKLTRNMAHGKNQS
jgi:hypothetical protein